ncbi:8995_t:CDS:10 [Diversispora eburnea]|uniref:Sorting nexin MVP1 n=1 Tax=Diversispora eburnea TaxID=1213867 RepID=A0A9N8YZS8_9GLOM|nr:8995_t:CDS:10 [Diversispora eburnea]
MLEEDSMTGSFFEPSPFQTAQIQSMGNEGDVNSLSFMTDSFNVNMNIGGNPWDPPSANGIDVSNILSDVSLPEVYSSAFTLAQHGGRVSISALNKILGVSGLPHATMEKILNLTTSANSTRINRGEFNVALALVALAQKNMDLPEPIFTNLESVNFNRNLSFSTLPRPSMNSIPADDPWAISPSPSANGYTTVPFSTEVPVSIYQSPVTPQPVSNTSLTIPKEDEFHWFMDMDVITVKFAPEREGFLFKHVNYIVESQQRGTKVVRRYSDFWWLMECLIKKYPYRILPALPPKKIGANGFYFTVDETFLEKRRKGLTRFLNFIARHPVLKDDELVEIFLKEPIEIATWRKNNLPDLEEEYLKKTITPEIEQRIPTELKERLNKVYKRLDDNIEHYRNICNIMERIARRQEGMSTDYMRYSLALHSLIEQEKGCYREDCTGCGQVKQGLEEIATHFQKTSTIMEEAATATLETVLENLKRHRDLLVSFKETFERKNKLNDDSIETLNNRIKANQAKLAPLKEGVDPEAERLNTAIQKNFVNDQIKYSHQLNENWRLLNPKVYEMPVETSGFI